MEHRQVQRPVSRRAFLQQALLGSAALVGAGTFGCTRVAGGHNPLSPRTNLVFLFSDQHAFDMLGCNGNQQIKTPHLDRLAMEGLRYNHCIANAPVCTPSRGSLLSGLHPLRHGAFGNDIQMLPGTGNYLGEVLTRSGYRTGYFGKWHLLGGDRNRPIPAGPLRYGFDDLFLSNNCTLEFDADAAHFWNERGERELYGDWEPYAQAKQAIQFLDRQNSQQPFALFVAWHPPHDLGKRSGEYLYDAEADLMSLYDPSSIQVRTNADDTAARRRQYQGYMAMCSGVDHAAGMILDALKLRGLDRNTLVVYTADHGDLLGSHGRPKPKGYPEQESIRIPLLMRQPGVMPAGVSSDLLIGLLDMMPTLLGLLGLQIPESCQGLNLAEAILRGHDEATDSVPLYFFAPAWRGVYTRQFTYAFDKGTAANAGACRVLYDRSEAPDESINRYAHPEYRAVREQLHGLTMEWLRRFGDPCPTSSELFRVCGLDPDALGLPGTEAVLSGPPSELLARASFTSFLRDV